MTGTIPITLPTINAYRRSPLTLYWHFPPDYALPTLTVALYDEYGTPLANTHTPVISSLGQLISVSWTATQVAALPDYVRVEVLHDGTVRQVVRITPTDASNVGGLDMVLSDGINYKVTLLDTDAVRAALIQAEMATQQATISTQQAVMATQKAELAEQARTTATQEAGVSTDMADAAIAAKNTAVQAKDTTVTLAAQVTQDKATVTEEKGIVQGFRNEAEGFKNDTQEARNEALDLITMIQEGIFEGDWNAATNTPALSPIPPAGRPDGIFYKNIAVGTVSFAGVNFLSGSTMNPGDALWKKGTQWVRIPFAVGDATISKAKLGPDAMKLLGETINSDVYNFVMVDTPEGRNIVLACRKDATWEGKFDLSRSVVPRASLDASILDGLMTPFESSWWHPYIFVIDDEDGNVGMGIKKDRTLVAKIELPDGSIQEATLSAGLLAKLPTTDFLRINAYNPTDFDWNEDDELWRGQEVEVPCKTHRTGIAFQKLPNVRTNGIRGYNDTGTALEFRRNSGLVIRGERYRADYAPSIGSAELVTSKGWYTDGNASLPANPVVGDYWLCMFLAGNPTTRTVGGVTMSKWDILYYTAGGWAVQPSPVVASDLKDGDFWNVTAVGKFWRQVLAVGDRLLFLGTKAQSSYAEPIWIIQKAGEYYLMGECNPATFAPATVQDFDLYAVSVDGTYSGIDLKKGDYLYRNTGWGKSEGSLVTVAAGNAYALPCRNSNEYSVRRVDKSATQVGVKARANVTLGNRRASKDLVLYSDSMFGVNVGASIASLLTDRTVTTQSYGGGTSINVASMVKYNIRNADPYKGRLHTFWHGQNNSTDLVQIKAAALEMSRLAGVSQGRFVFWSMLGQSIYSWNGTRFQCSNHEDAFNRTNNSRFVELEDWYEQIFPGRHFSPRKAALVAAVGRTRPHLLFPGMSEAQVAATYGILPLSYFFNFADKPFTAEQLTFLGYHSTAGLPTGGVANDYYLRTANGTVGAIIVNVAGTWTEYTYDVTHVTAEGGAALAQQYINFLTANFL